MRVLPVYSYRPIVLNRFDLLHSLLQLLPRSCAQKRRRRQEEGEEGGGGGGGGGRRRRRRRRQRGRKRPRRCLQPTPSNSSSLRHVSFAPASPLPRCVPTVPMSRATILLSHRFPMYDPSSFLEYFRRAARLPFSPSLLLRGAIPPLRPLLLPAGWRSTEVGGREEAKLGGGGRHFMEVKRTRRKR
ncbi:hypothetical protein PUN28_011635 [Cardiocondyla obscurior]|uniref:Uncharacterized protein n=1 Tax=Cardiocondyla obscurior TaxID=286306 RepID=A0AAW2FGA1_9HYME